MGEIVEPCAVCRRPGGVVAHEQHGATEWIGPGEDTVADGVAGAVDAGGLAVPEADHAVVAGVGAGGGQGHEDLGAISRWSGKAR